jgi:hypothetical protein
VDVFQEIFAAADALRDRNTAPALAWAKDNGSRLRRIGVRCWLAVIVVEW